MPFNPNVGAPANFLNVTPQGTQAMQYALLNALQSGSQGLGQAAQAFGQRRQSDMQLEALANLLGGTGAQTGSLGLDPGLAAPTAMLGQSPSLVGTPGAPGAIPGLTPDRARMLVDAAPDAARDALVRALIPQPGEGFTLSPGQTRFAGPGQPIAALPGEPTSTEQRLIAAGLASGTPEAREFLLGRPPAAPSMSYYEQPNLDPRDQPIPIAELAKLTSPDGQALPVGTTYRMAQEKGVITSEAAQAGRAAQEAASIEEAQTTAARDVLVPALDRMESTVGSPDYSRRWAGNAPDILLGNEYAQLRSDAEMIRSNMTFAKLREVPSLAPISDSDLDRLASAAGGLNVGLDEPPVAASKIQSVRRMYLDLLKKAGSKPSASASPPAGASFTTEQLQNMSLEELMEAAGG